jgi:hypothetical protein
LNKSKKVEFNIREITQGSKKKTYGPYIGYLEKLTESKYKPNIYKKYSMKGGEGGEGGITCDKDNYYYYHLLKNHGLLEKYNNDYSRINYKNHKKLKELRKLLYNKGKYNNNHNLSILQKRVIETFIYDRQFNKSNILKKCQAYKTAKEIGLKELKDKNGTLYGYTIDNNNNRIKHISSSGHIPLINKQKQNIIDNIIHNKELRLRNRLKNSSRNSSITNPTSTGKGTSILQQARNSIGPSLMKLLRIKSKRD